MTDDHRRCECGARVGMVPRAFACIDPSCDRRWPRVARPPTGAPTQEDRTPERERLAARDRQRRADGRAREKRLGLR